MSELLLVNAAATAAIVEAGAALRTPPRVLLAGSGFEYQPQVRPHVESDPLDRGGAYALSKVTAGDAARSLASAISVTVLRLFGVYGPGERAPRLLPAVVEATQAGHPVELTAGDQIRDYTFVGDVAEAFMRLADTHLGIGVRMVNVGTGRPVSVRAFVEAAASALRRRGLSPDLRFGARESRQDERSVYVANVELLRQWLEWVPDTPLERGLEQSMEEMLAHPR